VTVRVLLADDHPVVREGLRALIATTGDLEVVAEAGDGREAIRLARQHAPGAVVMDLSMPLLDGAAAAREILTVRPGTGIVILTMHTDDATPRHNPRAGSIKPRRSRCLDKRRDPAIPAVSPPTPHPGAEPSRQVPVQA
jgi:DNA-binding NarL/FixJ family response regulator